METTRLEVSRNRPKNPFYSICIPQHNRTSFLIEACRQLERQTCKDFELCISDDCSTDGRREELLAYLRQSAMPFVYLQQKSNLRYDGNLRASMELASGRYCLLMGNDDCLKAPDDLAFLRDILRRHGEPEVALANYEDFRGARVYRRMRRTGILGQGPSAATDYFRSFSFVSGVFLKNTAVARHATDKWDGSEMYQMYVGCRMLAEGGRLLGVDRVVIRQGIAIEGEEVDSHRSRPKEPSFPVKERPLPMHRIVPLVADAIRPFLDERKWRKEIFGVYRQLLLFTYPFWIIEYRRVQSWGYAAGIFLAMRPKRVLANTVLAPGQIFLLNAICLVAGCGALIFPIGLFDGLRPHFYKLAKSK